MCSVGVGGWVSVCGGVSVCVWTCGWVGVSGCKCECVIQDRNLGI